MANDAFLALTANMQRLFREAQEAHAALRRPTSAILCEHANEVPRGPCPCPAGCSCAWSLAGRLGPEIIPLDG